MNRKVCIAVAAAAGIAIVAATHATAGNRWMMERMADDLNRLNKAAVKVSPEKPSIVRVVKATVAGTSVARRLPVEMAGTPAYESLTRQASLDIPVVVSK
jgi:hypothetical protein